MTESARNSPPDRRLTILMTEGSSISARQALYALGPQHTIDVMDPSPLCQCRFSRFVRRWYRCPSFGRDPCGYLLFLGRQLRSQQYDALFPAHEEVYLLARVRSELAQMTATAIPEFSAVDQLHSKVRFLALLDALQLPYPQTRIATTWQETDEWPYFPSYLKLDIGTAGQGVVRVRERSELLAALRRFEEAGQWSSGAPLLLQRPAPGRQSAARAVFRRGKLIGVHMNELQQRGVGGAATARVSSRHHVVADHLRRLGRHLEWHGPLFLEYFFDAQTNTPLYIEADPRIGDTANATLSGANLCEQWLDIALDRPVRQQPEPVVGVQSHAGYLVLLSRALESGRRRQIVREVWRQWRHAGIYENSHDELTRPREDWLSLLPYAWVAGQLLLRPATAERIVRSTVESYSATADAARRIRDWPAHDLLASLRGEQ